MCSHIRIYIHTYICTHVHIGHYECQSVCQLNGKRMYVRTYECTFKYKTIVDILKTM